MSYSLKNKETKLNNGISEDPIVSLVDRILYAAIHIGASDIHLEPGKNEMRVRYRIDGVLHCQRNIEKDQSSQVVSRIKVLGTLDIAEKRVPQDGKIRVEFYLNDKNFRDIDLRISTFPTLYGEKMVIRILDRLQHTKELESLGMNDSILNSMQRLLKQPHGFFLVTGPTGSGKTTTLYALLSQLNTDERNIVTMEDPIEYQIDGITQSQINVKAGFGFEEGMRSVLRQDPDVILIGEIRDKKTVQIAIEAALTGHLVLSTLHTNDAAGAITRLIDMGIEPFLITASLNGVLAQRLARCLCPSCRVEVPLVGYEKTFVEEQGIGLKNGWGAEGCDKCNQMGYRGRLGLFEWLDVNDLICDLIVKKASVDKIRGAALANGMRMLGEDGLLKVREGRISLEEYFRVGL